jgi:broad specificity phosphatase PhoE
MTMLLIRHAATDLAGRLCGGRSDPPLNRLGLQQAETLASSLRETKLERVYTSHLKRAIQTAVPVMRPETQWIMRSDLGEINYGEWEGRRWADITNGASEIRSYEESPNSAAPGGETFQAFQSRVLTAFEHVVHDTAGKSVAVFTHMGVIRAIMGSLFPHHPDWNPDAGIEHCAVYRLGIRY